MEQGFSGYFFPSLLKFFDPLFGVFFELLPTVKDAIELLTGFVVSVDVFLFEFSALK
jgi:hypothetical protein